MEEVLIPDGFLRLRDAVASLVKGMYASFPQPKPLHKVKLDHQKASVGFGPWKEAAAQRLRAAACNGELSIFVIDNSNREPVVLRPDIVGRLMIVRGGLPEHPIRPTIKIAGGDARLFKLLTSGILLVSRNDFVSWYETQRRKGRWPSQRSKKALGHGRPSKITASLREAVGNALQQRKVSVAELRRCLIASGRTDVPSIDTLERLVDQLHRETGRSEFFRNKRSRRKRI